MSRVAWLSSFALLWASVAWAEPTLELRVSGPREVLPGDPETASVDAQGRITMGPRVIELTQTGDHPVVSLAADTKGTIYAGTAGGGLKVIRSGGQKRQWLKDEPLVILLWQPEEPLFFRRPALTAASSRPPLKHPSHFSIPRPNTSGRCWLRKST